MVGLSILKSAWPQQSYALLLILCSELYLFGSPFLGEICAYVTTFYSNHIGSHILSSWLVHAGCVFVAGIHPSRTWISGSFGSVRWNACVHRLDLGLYSHPKEFGVVEPELMLTPIYWRLRGGLNLWRCIMQDSERHTSDWAILGE